MFVVPAGMPSHVLRIGNPFDRWRMHRTANLHRFDHAHELHDENIVFRSGRWKLLVRMHLVWRCRIELYDGRTGRHIFQVIGPEKMDEIRLTSETGYLVRTIRFGDNDYKEYLDLCVAGGGQDPHARRT